MRHYLFLRFAPEIIVFTAHDMMLGTLFRLLPVGSVANPWTVAQRMVAVVDASSWLTELSAAAANSALKKGESSWGDFAITLVVRIH